MAPLSPGAFFYWDAANIYEPISLKLYVCLYKVSI